jgi:hypothetical protein
VSSCREPLDLATLVDYWFGDLDGPDLDPVEEHLLECDSSVQVTLVCAEPWQPYDRVNLGKLLTGSRSLTSLKKIDGKWKLEVTSLLDNPDPAKQAAAIAQAIEDADTASDAITLTMQRLADNKFKSTDELTESFRSQIMKLVTDRRATAATNRSGRRLRAWQ